MCIHSVFPPKRWGILILKSLNHWGRGFFHHMGGHCPYEGGVSDNDNKRRGHNSGQQLSHYNIFSSNKKFPRKYSFHFYIISFKRTYLNCSVANFKRVASSHEKLYNEQ